MDNASSGLCSFHIIMVVACEIMLYSL